MQHSWTQAEDDFVRDNAGLLTDSRMAAALSRLTPVPVTAQAVRQARHRLGIDKAPLPGGQGPPDQLRRGDPPPR